MVDVGGAEDDNVISVNVSFVEVLDVVRAELLIVGAIVVVEHPWRLKNLMNSIYDYSDKKYLISSSTVL